MTPIDTRITALLARGRSELVAARAALSEKLSAAAAVAVEAHQSGVPETVISESLGVSRNTVRVWLGKGKKVRDVNADSDVDSQAG